MRHVVRVVLLGRSVLALDRLVIPVVSPPQVERYARQDQQAFPLNSMMASRLTLPPNAQ